MSTVSVDIHHGGYFMDQSNNVYQGEVSNWICDTDYWCFFDIEEYVGKLGYKDYISMWYEVGGVKKRLSNDIGAKEMSDWAKGNGKVNLFLVHPVSQPNYIIYSEAQPETQTEAQYETNNEAQHEMYDGDSDDSALDVLFGDSDDELLNNDDFGDAQTEVAVLREISPTIEDNEERRKRLGGKKRKGAENEGNSSKKKKAPTGRKRGRPKKTIVEKDLNMEPSVEPNVLIDDDDFNWGTTKRQELVMPHKGLSDDEYVSEELVSDESGENSDEESTRKKFPGFVMPKKMLDYKWVLGTLFSDREEFKAAITTYAVHNGVDVKIIKNDKIRVRAACKDPCQWRAYCAKLPNEDTWQLRKLYDEHSCPKDYKVSLMKSSWLAKRLEPTVRETPNITLTSISNKAHRKWNVGVSKMKAYRARRAAIELVDGSFREQYLRLYDYSHELMRSNPESTVKLQVQETIVEDRGDNNEEIYVDRPLLPSFQRLYMCLKGCKDSFKVCRPIIGLDGCFLKGYYGGQILAAVGRDPNDQMLPIGVAVVESETKDSWDWFLKLLVDDLGGPGVCNSYTFISDQQKVSFTTSRVVLLLSLPSF